MATPKDITGKVYGRLTAVSYEGNRKWIFSCACGNTKLIQAKDVCNGKTSSCGCLFREMISARNYRHGMRKTRLYSIWMGMHNRCNNSNADNYRFYGGKGVKLHWGSFQDFYKDMGSSYKEGLTIERIDSNGDYCKENCRWATWEEQFANRGGKFAVQS